MAAGMKSVEFRREREKSWRALDALVVQIETRGIASLSEAQLTRLPALHRAVVSSLSVARSISLDRNLIEYLEALTARSYFCVYGTRRHLRDALADFLLVRFPGLVRRFRWHLLVAAAFLGLGMAAGFALVRADEDLYYSLVSEDLAQGRNPSASTDYLRGVLYGGDEHGGEELTLFASQLFTHNAQIGILAFALGFAAGLPVFYLLFTNGLMLGAMAALYHGRGLSLDFWGWILPHGVTELLAIALCGAAGLVLAGALLFPGREERLVHLAREGRRAGQLILGSVVLFFLAGLIEGFFRQMVQDLGVRYLVVALTAAAWVAYFSLVGRRAPR